MTPYSTGEEIRVGLSYRREVVQENNRLNRIIVHPFSEPIPFNYCPNCGEYLNPAAEMIEEDDWRIQSVRKVVSNVKVKVANKGRVEPNL